MLIDKTIPLRYIFSNVKADLSVSLVFILVVILIKYFLPELNLNIAIPALLGTAISLVLAFKLSQSYDRWWEARKIWGEIVNDSRTLINQIQGFSHKHITSNEDIESFAFRQIAWCYALAYSLRNLNPLDIISKFLSKTELEALQGQVNIPLKLMNNHNKQLNKLLKEESINEFQQIQIDKTLVRMVASMGKAERIKNTVFPRTYRIFLRFFIYLFILTLAIALDNLNPMYEIGLLLLIAFPFFLLKSTAQHMQDPFENRPTDTAMLTISKTIEINLKQLINKEISQPEEKETFFKM